MNSLLKALSFVLILGVAACVPLSKIPEAAQATGMNVPTSLSQEQTPNPTVASTQAPNVSKDLTPEKLMNSAYFSPLFKTTVQLSEGSYSAEDGNSTISVHLLPQVAIGDLNGDGQADAAVLLAENGGGSGVFVSLVVITSQEGKFVQAGDALVDDRPQIQSLEIVDGQIQLAATIHGINDSMAEPTLKVGQKYRLLDGRLTLMAQATTYAGGSERSISIDSPADGSQGMGEVQLTGSMPVAPFENNLRLTFYDLAGNVLDQTGFMVSSADVGLPATFDQTIQLPEGNSDRSLRLELADLSAADGSILAMNSVVIHIKK